MKQHHLNPIMSKNTKIDSTTRVSDRAAKWVLSIYWVYDKINQKKHASTQKSLLWSKLSVTLARLRSNYWIRSRMLNRHTTVHFDLLLYAFDFKTLYTHVQYACIRVYMKVLITNSTWNYVVLLGCERFKLFCYIYKAVLKIKPHKWILRNLVLTRKIVNRLIIRLIV